MCLSFLPDFCLAGVTFVWTAVHGHLLGLPVNLQVVLLEPGEVKEDILLSQVHDCEGAFGVVIGSEDCIRNLHNGACFIWSAIYIVDLNGMEVHLGGEVVAFQVAPVHELSHGTAVYWGWTGFDLSSVCELDPYFDDQGFGAWGRCDYILPWKVSLPGLELEEPMQLDGFGCNFIWLLY